MAEVAKWQSVKIFLILIMQISKLISTFVASLRRYLNISCTS